MEVLKPYFFWKCFLWICRFSLCLTSAEYKIEALWSLRSHWIEKIRFNRQLLLTRESLKGAFFLVGIVRRTLSLLVELLAFKPHRCCICQLRRAMRDWDYFFCRWTAYVSPLPQRIKLKKPRNYIRCKICNRRHFETDFLILFLLLKGGDVIAQCGESYHNNLERVKEGKEEIKLAVNWKRAGKKKHLNTVQLIDY